MEYVQTVYTVDPLQGFSGFLCSQESPLQAALNGGCPFNAQLLSDMSHANVLTLWLKRCHYEFLHSGINVQHAILVIHAIESESLNLNVSRGLERLQSIQRRCLGSFGVITKACSKSFAESALLEQTCQGRVGAQSLKYEEI